MNISILRDCNVDFYAIENNIWLVIFANIFMKYFDYMNILTHM